MPKRAIQPLTNASATVSAVMLLMGMASGQRVKQLMQVRRYVKPRDGGSGPIISMCTMSKRASSVENVARGVTVFFDLWHCRHDCAHLRTSDLMLGQT